MTEKDINLDIEGLGIIMFSDFATENIKLGEDYLTDNYWKPDDVAKHIREGSIVGFCTSSPGTYIIKFRNGYPSNQDISSSEFTLRLGIEVRDGRICIDDLYSLMEWENNSENFIAIENGYYHITLIGNKPSSNIIGDNQVIFCYLAKLDEMPTLNHLGVPRYC